MKIVHIITGLSTGGAEVMLFRLLAQSDKGEFQSQVISLTNLGEIGKRIAALGIPVDSLGMSPNLANPMRFLKLISLLHDIHPDIVQTWMYHANLIGGLAAKITRCKGIIWSLHNSTLDPKYSKKRTRLAAKIGAGLSHFIPTKIICCADTTRRVHRNAGYRDDKMTVIPNGFPVDELIPNNELRNRLRKNLGIADDAFVIGHIGRFDPQKDYINLLRSAGIVVKQQPGTRFLLCGRCIRWDNEELAQMIEEAEVRENVDLLGPQQNIIDVLSTMDILVSSSAYGEAFPMVIGEAMSCELPCVVTDVGDSSVLVGNTGDIVPPCRSDLLADAILKMIATPEQERHRLGALARRRIQQKYSLSSIADLYEAEYRSIVDRCVA